MSKLNIGCGNLPIDGYINVDKYYYPDSPWPLTNQKRVVEWKGHEHVGEWIYGDVLKLPFDSNNFDEVNMSHLIEHLSMEEGNLAIMEACRVLKTGGFLDIACPDLKKACEEYLKVEYQPGPVDNSHWYYVMGMIYGTSGKDGEGQFHHCGYSRQYLKLRMEIRGLKDIVEIPGALYHKAEFNFCLRGYKR